MASDRPIEGIGRTNGLQVLAVCAGLKSSTRINVEGDDAVQVGRRLSELGLVWVLGYDTVRAEPTLGRNGYSEWARRRSVRAVDEQPQRYLYAARTIADAEVARALDEAGNDRAFGAAMGYPACCIEKFATRGWGGEPAWAIDPVLSTYRQSCDAKWLMNVSFLHEDFAVLAHVPCSDSCTDSLRLGEDLVSLLRARTPEAAEHLETRLRGVVLHSAFLGVARLELKKVVDGDRLSRDVREGPLAGVLRAGDEVRADAHGISVGPLILAARYGKLFRFLT